MPALVASSSTWVFAGAMRIMATSATTNSSVTEMTKGLNDERFSMNAGKDKFILLLKGRARAGAPVWGGRECAARECAAGDMRKRGRRMLRGSRGILKKLCGDECI